MNLKESMLEEAELKTQVCENMLEKTSNLGEIAKLSQKIDRVKKDVERKSTNLLRNIPDQYFSPLLICAQYQITLNYSLEQYEKYVEKFNHQCMKFERSLKETTLNNENLYQNSNAVLLISGEKSNNGKILFCSPSIRSVCGKETNSFVGSHVSRLFPSTLGTYYGELFRGIFTAKADSILNKPMSVFLQNQNGHIVKSEIYIQVHPYVTLNLCLQMMIRPIPTVKDYLLVSEDGVIEGASHKISKLLDISPGSVDDLENISEELFYLLKEQIWTENMRMLQFTPVMKRERGDESPKRFVRNYWYQCEIRTLVFGEKSLKLISMNQSDKGKSSIFHKERTGVLNPKTIIDEEEEESSSDTESENVECEERIDENNNMDGAPYTTWTPRETHLYTEALPTSPNRLLTFKDTERFGLAESSSIGENEEVSISQRLKSHSMSQRSREVHNSRYFRLAVSSSSDPKSFMILCLIFYCVIVGVCVGQILLMVVSIQTMDDLEVKKDLLRYAETRSFRANMISINSIGGALQIAGSLDPSAVLQGILTVVNNINFHRNSLAAANENILKTLDELDVSLQDNLRMKDVQLAGSYMDDSDSSSVNLTSFQFVDSVGSAITGLVEMANPASRQGVLYLNFLSDNIANDFLAKNEEIRNIFIESVETQRQDLENTINLCLILAPLLLLGLALTIILIIWAQYKMERDYLLAFLKLSPSAIRRIQFRFRNFSKSLMNEANFKSVENYGSYLFSLSSIIQEEFKTYNRKQKDKGVKYSQLRLKYYAYVGKVILYISPLMILLPWDFISAKNSAAIIYKQEEQLEFAQLISTEAAYLVNTFDILFSENNTLKIQHSDAFEVLSKGAEDLKDIISQIPNKFKEANGNYDPYLQQMIFEGAECDTFPSEDSTYCVYLESKGLQTHLLSAAVQFQTAVQGKVTDYINVNKTSMAKILGAAFVNLQMLTATSITLAADAQLMAEKINENLSHSISHFNSQRNLFLILFIIGLIIVGILIWFQILKQLREIDNNFKKVLIIFPPNLILSSFLLKMFLKRTSNQILGI